MTYRESMQEVAAWNLVFLVSVFTVLLGVGIGAAFHDVNFYRVFRYIGVGFLGLNAVVVSIMMLFSWVYA